MQQVQVLNSLTVEIFRLEAGVSYLISQKTTCISFFKLPICFLQSTHCWKALFQSTCWYFAYQQRAIMHWEKHMPVY